MGIGKSARALETFRMVPDRMTFDDRLESHDVRLWCIMLFLARGRDTCDATDVTLAEKLGANERTIRRALVRLESCQFITRRREGERRIITLNPQGDGQLIPEFTLRIVAG